MWINIRVVFCFKDLCSNSGLIRFCLLLYFYFTQYLFWLALHKKEGEDKKIGKTKRKFKKKQLNLNRYMAAQGEAEEATPATLTRFSNAVQKPAELTPTMTTTAHVDSQQSDNKILLQKIVELAVAMQATQSMNTRQSDLNLFEAQVKGQPWRCDQRIHQERRQLTTTLQERRIQFEAKLKHGMCTPEEATEAIYGLYATEREKEQRTAALVTMTTPQLMTAHNWAIADKHGDLFVATYGHLITNLPWPLFPPHCGLDGYNLKLLDDYANGSIEGGAGKRDRIIQPRTSVFKRAGRIDGGCSGIEGGEYYVPVVNGTVDLTPVEEMINFHTQQLHELSRMQEAAAAQQNLNLASRGRAGGWTGNNGGRGGRARGRGRWRGRGGPTGRGTDGGTTTQTAVAPPLQATPNARPATQPLQSGF